MYWAHQPPELHELFELPSDKRQDRAVELALKGFTVDGPIMVYGWGPFQTMSLRMLYGFTWVPSLLGQPVKIAPGLGSPGNLPPYDPKNPPAGSIKVSLDPVDYPPFALPEKPPAPSGEVSPVGDFIYTVAGIGDMYAEQPWDHTRDGQRVENDVRGAFVKHVKKGPFGDWGYFVLA